MLWARTETSMRIWPVQSPYKKVDISKASERRVRIGGGCISVIAYISDNRE